MGNPWEENDDSAQDGSNLPNEARQYLRKMKQERDALAAKLADMEKTNRSATVAAVVKDKGYDPKVATFIPDTVSDTAGVEKWLEDNGAMFVKATQGSPDGGQQAAPQDDSLFPPEMMRQFQAVNDVAANAAAPGRYENLIAQINDTKNEEELTKLLKQALPKGMVLA